MFVVMFTLERVMFVVMFTLVTVTIGVT